MRGPSSSSSGRRQPALPDGSGRRTARSAVRPTAPRTSRSARVARTGAGVLEPSPPGRVQGPRSAAPRWSTSHVNRTPARESPRPQRCRRPSPTRARTPRPGVAPTPGTPDPRPGRPSRAVVPGRPHRRAPGRDPSPVRSSWHPAPARSVRLRPGPASRSLMASSSCSSRMLGTRTTPANRKNARPMDRNTSPREATFRTIGSGMGTTSPMISRWTRKSSAVPGSTTCRADVTSTSVKPAASSADAQIGM